MRVLLLFQISVPTATVLLGGEPGQSIFVDVYSKRVDASKRNVDSEIELIAVYQQRIIYVLAGYHLLSGRDLVYVLGDKYAFALGARCWFDDPLSLRVFCHLFFKSNHFVWEQKGQGEKFEMLVT
jgi:hypothetical protein